MRPYWKVFALAILGMLGTAATEPVFPAIMKYLLDRSFKTEDPRMVWLAPLAIILLFMLRAIFSIATNYLMAWLSTRLITDIRMEMFSKVLLLPTQHFHDQSAGRITSKLMYEVGNISEAATYVLVTALRESFTAIALLSYLVYLDWKLTLITLVVGPLIALVVKGFSRRMRMASRMSYEAFHQLVHIIEETANAHKVIKIFGGEVRQTQRFRDELNKFRRAQLREAVPAAAITPVTHLAASLAVAIITFMALGKATGDASASVGGFVSFITSMLMLIAPVKQLTTINATLQRGLAAAEGVFGMLDSAVELDQGTRQLGRARGHIEFEQVCFSYPGAERQALSGIGFTIAAGQRIALVGASGGGKTTVSALLPRFYSPTAGQIRIDGIDIAELTLSSLRTNIALVSQDIVLFNDTVAANIAFGSQVPCSQEEIVAAAQAANAWEFIENLPQGLNTHIGENGAKLSGGQRQRIAIARAVLKNAPILILDEATSALDTESERLVQSALLRLMHHRTTLVIAHRLSTISDADRILVLQRGQIVESGTHQELLRHPSGYYANLINAQT